MYRTKEITEKIHRNQETLFNSKTNEPHRFNLHLVDIIDLKKSDKNIALVNLSINYKWKTSKMFKTTTKLKCLFLHGMMSLNYLMDHFFLADIYDYLEYLIKKHETLTSNSPVKIYVNKIKNCIVLK